MTRRALSGVSARRGAGPGVIQATPELSVGASFPAPVEGWDSVTPLAQMPETRAIRLENVFPQPGYVEVRKGHKTHNLVAGGDAVNTLMSYHALVEADDRLFACASSNISNVTVFTTATSSVAVSGLGSSKFQYVNFSNSAGNFLWAVNGVDPPQIYNGTSWIVGTVTSSASTVIAANIVSVAVFKERLWLVQKDKLFPAHLGVGAIQGTANVFDLVGVFNKGGILQAIGTWSIGGGQGPDDYIAFVTDRGEVAVYTGTDPASNFVLRGVYEIGSPIGRRCLTKVGSDLAVVSIDGVLPLSQALVTERGAINRIALTRLIQPTMNQSARDWGANFGWELISYPRGTRAILNVPRNEGVLQVQYIMNTVTGAWCCFKDENANTWTVFQDRLFFGGNNGNVMEADCQGFDEGQSINFDIETAFNYFGARGRLKQFTMCRALLTTDGQISPGLTVNVDFNRNEEVSILTAPVEATALWDVALWDGGVWPETVRIVTDWLSISGIGYCASIRMSGFVDPGEDVPESQAVTFQINGWDVLMIGGGFL